MKEVKRESEKTIQRVSIPDIQKYEEKKSSEKQKLTKV